PWRCSAPLLWPTRYPAVWPSCTAACTYASALRWHCHSTGFRGLAVHRQLPLPAPPHDVPSLRCQPLPRVSAPAGRGTCSPHPRGRPRLLLRLVAATRHPTSHVPRLARGARKPSPRPTHYACYLHGDRILYRPRLFSVDLPNFFLISGVVPVLFI